MSEQPVETIGHYVTVPQVLLDEAEEFREGMHRWAEASPEQRAEWEREAAQARAAERAAAPRVEVSVERLADTLGFTVGQAEHLVQPWCECSVGADGWWHCQHWYDEGLDDQ